jgi:predicted nucleotidyltransferase
MFGSRARGDHRLSSDVDLLGIVESGHIRDVLAVRGASFYQYPVEFLKQKSRSGDLFLLHLTTEGKVLHDTVGVFEEVRKNFAYRNSYTDEIREASAVIWYLTSHKVLIQSRQGRKRLAWAFRTILIARSAEQQLPSFSSSSLAEFAEIPGVKAAIDKRFTAEPETLRDVALTVASKFGISRRQLDWPSDRMAQERLLAEMGGVAKVTVEGSRRAKKAKPRDEFHVFTSYM